MDWMLLPLQRYAEFSGRSQRKEYWMFQLLVLGVYAFCIALFFAGMTFPEAGTAPAFENFGLLSWIAGTILVFFVLGTIIPQIAVMVRRFHDCNLSGWAYFGMLVLSAIPLIGFLFNLAVLVITCVPGTRGPNKFGPSPKDEDMSHVFA